MTLNVGAIQTTYGAQPGALLNGQLFREAGDEYLKSVIAIEKIRFGGALAYSGDPKNKDKVRHLMQTKFVITQSVDFVASNSTVGDITVKPLGGAATTTSLTATVYAASHADTMEAIAVKIEAIAGVDRVDVDATARTYTIYADGDYDISAAAFVTTGGTGQPTFTHAADSADVIEGIAERSYTVQPDSNGDVYYSAGDTLRMLRKGGIAAVTEETMTTTSSLFARFAAGNGVNEHRGVLRASAGSPAVAAAVTGVEIEQGASADEVAKFEINKP